MRHLLVLSIVLSFGLSSCGSAGKKESTSKADDHTMELKNNYWVLESLNGEKINHPDDPRMIGFQIDKEENRLSGFAGCNNFMGSLKNIGKSEISFSELGSTKMACLTSTFNENDFLNMFKKVDNYKIDGDKLNLLSGDNVVASFTAKAKDINELTEKRWKLIEINGSKAKMPKDQGPETHFVLKSTDNKMVGYDGCNNLSGTYKVEKGNTISFDNTIKTLRACPDRETDEIAFSKIINQKSTFTLKGDRLSLKGEDGLEAVFEAVYLD